MLIWSSSDSSSNKPSRQRYGSRSRGVIDHGLRIAALTQRNNQYIISKQVEDLASAPTRPAIQCYPTPAHRTHENDTNFGSRGMPSAPIPFFLNRCSIYTRRASSKLIPLNFINRWTSRLAVWSRPPRESPSTILLDRSKSADVKPDSTSPMNVVGTRVYDRPDMASWMRFGI